MAIELDANAYEAARRTMVDCQVRPSDVTQIELIDAMLWAPREQFLPKPRRAQAYVGEHVEIAPGRFELDPRSFAKMVDAAEPRRDDLALVVGAGMGYAAAVLARMTAAVVACEEDPALSAAAEQALSALGLDNAMVFSGPLTDGCAAHGPYNLIVVNGGVETFDGSRLFDQLSDGGRLAAIRMSGAIGRCEVYVKSGDAIGSRRAFDAASPILPGFARKSEFEF